MSSEDLSDITESGDYTITISDSEANSIEQTFTVSENLIIDTSISIEEGTLIANQENATYQWIKCSPNVPTNGFDKTFTPTENGDYAVEIQVGNCIELSECITISNIEKSIDEEETIKLYPNPVIDVLNIELDKAYNLVNVHVFNSGGLKVGDYTFKNKRFLDMNIGAFTTGIYLVNINTGEKEITKYKIIKK